MSKKKKTCPTQSRPGVAKQFLTEHFSDFPDGGTLKIGHVLFLFLKSDKSVAQTIQAVTEKLGVPCVICIHHMRAATVDILGKFNHLTREKEMDAFAEICHQPFTDYSVVQESEMEVENVEPEPIVPPTSPEVQPDPTPPFQPESRPLIPMPSTSREPIAGPSTPPVSCRSMEKITPRKRLLKRRLYFVSQTKCVMKKRYYERVKELRAKINLEKQVKIKYLNQAIKRKTISLSLKDGQITRLKKKLAEKELSMELVATKRKLEDLRRIHNRLKESNKIKRAATASITVNMVPLEEHEKKLEESSVQILKLQNEKLVLEETVDELKKEKLEKSSKKDKKTYGVETRMMVYDSIVNHVPTHNIPVLMRKFGDRFGLTLSEIPQRSSVEQMTRELGVVSDYQCAEMLLQEDNLTLGFDATTQEGVHVNSIHLTSKEKCQVLDVEQLAGGTAEDYMMHITETVDRVADVYSIFNELEFQECRSKMITNIKNTMTDRAAVNHATVVRLEDTWGTRLNELNCHLHPLDTIASSVRSALKAVEPSDLQKKLFGKDCIASQLVLAINKLRFKDGKGDPKGFCAALDDSGLGRGLLPRYRGNRLHILFDICGKLVGHVDFFEHFFNDGTVSCGGLQAAIATDFQSPVAKMEIQVLGLIGKLLSGPWMTKFYTSAEEQVSHIDGISIIKDVLVLLKAASENPALTLTTKEDFFGKKLLAEDPTLLKLQQGPVDHPLFLLMMKSALLAVVSVIEKQYKRYFSLDITDQLKRETLSARAHNIDAEQVMGMFSASAEHTPNATLCFLSSRIRAQKNRVVDYLDNLQLEKRDRLIPFVITVSRKQRFGRRKNSQKIKQEILKRIADKKQKKEQLNRGKVETKLKNPDLDISKEFSAMDVDSQQGARDILDGKCVGRKICHVWFDDSHGKTVYHGQIQKLKKKGGGTYVVAYWGDNETYAEDAVDYDVSKFALAADLLCGDLTLS